jgi:hypothetical protein
MRLRPDSDLSNYKAANKLDGKVALITGGDSGIGRAVALAYAMEGADVAIAFNHSEEDAAETRGLVEARGRRCVTLLADVTATEDRERIVRETVDLRGRLDILVNNAAYFEGDGTLAELTEDGLRRTFETNIIAYMLMAQAALPHLERARGCIINTSSTTSLLGKKGSLAYASSKGRQRLHQVPGARACRSGYPRQLRAAGAILDPGDRHVRRGDGAQLRQLHHAWSRRPTGGDRTGLRVPGRRCLIRDGRPARGKRRLQVGRLRNVRIAR